MILAFVLTILIVGVVTAGLTIKFDRFFAILMLMFLFKYSVFDAVNVFLWIIMLGALMILLDNKEKIAGLQQDTINYSFRNSCNSLRAAFNYNSL